MMLNMNQTTKISDTDTVQSLSDEKARLMEPAIVYIALLMMSGIIGNILVWIYYGLVSRMSTNTFFIVVLATYDLLSCFISMPTEITDLINYYTFTSGAACKCLRFINYVCSIGSGLTLVAIAVDRYNRIYKPTQIHWTITKARLICVVLFCTAVFLAWPALFFYDTHEVPFGEQNGTELVGRDCTTTTQDEYSLYLITYNGIHFLIFIICSTSVCIMYSIVGKAIYKHRRSMTSYSNSQSKENSGNVTESLTQETELEHYTESVARSIGTTEHACCHTTIADSGNQCSGVLENADNAGQVAGQNTLVRIVSGKFKKTRSSKQAGIDKETMKITLVMIAVTSLFVLSFLPYLSLIIWRSIVGEKEENLLSGSHLVAYEIGLRSFLLNSGLNPWIYGIFNSSFRQYFYRKCTSCCR